MTESGAGYTFFWREVPEGTCCIHGVVFAVKTKLLQHIAEPPVGINEWMMSWRFSLAKKRFATLISAGTLFAQHNTKEDFYRGLDAVI